MFDTPPGAYTDITVSFEHACALTEASEIICWNIESGAIRQTPPGRYIAIAAAGGKRGEGSDTCAITENGEIVCWSWTGEPMAEYKFDPSREAPPGRYTALSISSGYACALTDEGEAVCWGAEDLWMAPPAPPLGKYRDISVGIYSPGLGGVWRTACAVAEGGDIVCWQAANDSDSPQRVARYEGDHSAVSVSGRTYCGLNTDGVLVGSCGMLGHGGLARYLTVDVGDSRHICAITVAGTILCESEAPSYYNSRVRVMNLPESATGRYFTLSVGRSYACALRDDGRADCWGDVENKMGQPDLAVGVYVALSSGDGHTCALREDGEVLCWGWNNFGQLEVPEGRYTAISTRPLHTCVRSADGEIACVGIDAPPDVSDWCGVADSGDPNCSKEMESVPADLPAGDYVAVSWGWHHGCALATTGEVRCWGTFGNPKDDPDYGPVEPPPGRYTAIASGSHRACALTDAGRVVCWGDTEFQRWPQWAPY